MVTVNHVNVITQKESYERTAYVHRTGSLFL